MFLNTLKTQVLYFKYFKSSFQAYSQSSFQAYPQSSFSIEQFLKYYKFLFIR